MSDIDDLNENIKKTVMLIDVGNGSGSGFIISKNGYMLTCYHVVNKATSIKARFEDNTELWYPCELINSHEEADIALLKINGENFDYSPIEKQGYSKDRRNERAIIAGYPLPDSLGITKVNFTSGNISNKCETLSGKTVKNYQVDINAYPGNSGGPLYSEKDRYVIGLLKGGYDEIAPGVNIVIDIQEFYNRLCQIDIINQEDSNGKN